MTYDWMVLPFSIEQAHQFRRGGWRAWARKYPMLFDELDSKNAAGQARRGYHFFEWLAAITVYEGTGHRSLLKKYNFHRHPRKVRLFRRLVPKKVFRLFEERERFGRTQGPDLFAYKENGDWFFCEVKGPKDRLRPTQRSFFRALEKASGKPVRLIRFVCLPNSR